MACINESVKFSFHAFSESKSFAANVCGDLVVCLSTLFISYINRNIKELIYKFVKYYDPEIII